MSWRSIWMVKWKRLWYSFSASTSTKICRFHRFRFHIPVFKQWYVKQPIISCLWKVTSPCFAISNQFSMFIADHDIMAIILRVALAAQQKLFSIIKALNSWFAGSKHVANLSKTVRKKKLLSVWAFFNRFLTLRDFDDTMAAILRVKRPWNVFPNANGIKTWFARRNLWHNPSKSSLYWRCFFLLLFINFDASGGLF